MYGPWLYNLDNPEEEGQPEKKSMWSMDRDNQRNAIKFGSVFRYKKGFRNMGMGRGNAKPYNVKVYKRPMLNMDLLNWWAYQAALQRMLNNQPPKQEE